MALTEIFSCWECGLNALHCFINALSGGLLLVVVAYCRPWDTSDSNGRRRCATRVVFSSAPPPFTILGASTRVTPTIYAHEEWFIYSESALNSSSPSVSCVTSIGMVSFLESKHRLITWYLPAGYLPTGVYFTLFVSGMTCSILAMIRMKLRVDVGGLHREFAVCNFCLSCNVSDLQNLWFITKDNIW